MAIIPNIETLTPPTADTDILNPEETDVLKKEESNVIEEVEAVEETKIVEDDEYIAKVYKALGVSINGFTKSEEDFYNEITTNKEYATKIYNVLSEHVDGFTKSEEDFYELVLKKKDISEISSEVSSEVQEVSSEVQEVPSEDDSKIDYEALEITEEEFDEPDFSANIPEIQSDDDLQTMLSDYELNYSDFSSNFKLPYKGILGGKSKDVKNSSFAISEGGLLYQKKKDSDLFELSDYQRDSKSHKDVDIYKSLIKELRTNTSGQIDKVDLKTTIENPYELNESDINLLESLYDSSSEEVSEFTNIIPKGFMWRDTKLSDEIKESYLTRKVSQYNYSVYPKKFVEENGSITTLNDKAAYKRAVKEGSVFQFKNKEGSENFIYGNWRKELYGLSEEDKYTYFHNMQSPPDLARAAVESTAQGTLESETAPTGQLEEGQMVFTVEGQIVPFENLSTEQLTELIANSAHYTSEIQTGQLPQVEIGATNVETAAITDLRNQAIKLWDITPGPGASVSRGGSSGEMLYHPQNKFTSELSFSIKVDGVWYTSQGGTFDRDRNWTGSKSGGNLLTLLGSVLGGEQWEITSNHTTKLDGNRISPRAVYTDSKSFEDLKESNIKSITTIETMIKESGANMTTDDLYRPHIELYKDIDNQFNELIWPLSYTQPTEGWNRKGEITYTGGGWSLGSPGQGMLDVETLYRMRFIEEDNEILEPYIEKLKERLLENVNEHSINYDADDHDETDMNGVYTEQAIDEMIDKYIKTKYDELKDVQIKEIKSTPNLLKTFVRDSEIRGVDLVSSFWTKNTDEVRTRMDNVDELTKLYIEQDKKGELSEKDYDRLYELQNILSNDGFQDLLDLDDRESDWDDAKEAIVQKSMEQFIQQALYSTDNVTGQTTEEHDPKTTYERLKSMYFQKFLAFKDAESVENKYVSDWVGTGLSHQVVNDDAHDNAEAELENAKLEFMAIFRLFKLNQHPESLRGSGSQVGTFFDGLLGGIDETFGMVSSYDETSVYKNVLSEANITLSDEEWKTVLPSGEDLLHGTGNFINFIGKLYLLRKIPGVKELEGMITTYASSALRAKKITAGTASQYNASKLITAEQAIARGLAPAGSTGTFLTYADKAVKTKALLMGMVMEGSLFHSAESLPILSEGDADGAFGTGASFKWTLHQLNRLGTKFPILNLLTNSRYASSPRFQKLIKRVVTEPSSFVAAGEIVGIMEAAESAMFDDYDMTDRFWLEMDNLYPNLGETSKRLLTSYFHGMLLSGGGMYKDMQHGIYAKDAIKLKHTIRKLREKDPENPLINELEGYAARVEQYYGHDNTVKQINELIDKNGHVTKEDLFDIAKERLLIYRGKEAKITEKDVMQEMSDLYEIFGMEHTKIKSKETKTETKTETETKDVKEERIKSNQLKSEELAQRLYEEGLMDSQGNFKYQSIEELTTNQLQVFREVMAEFDIMKTENTVLNNFGKGDNFIVKNPNTNLREEITIKNKHKHEEIIKKNDKENELLENSNNSIDDLIKENNLKETEGKKEEDIDYDVEISKLKKKIKKTKNKKKKETLTNELNDLISKREIEKTEESSSTGDKDLDNTLDKIGAEKKEDESIIDNANEIIKNTFEDINEGKESGTVGKEKKVTEYENILDELSNANTSMPIEYLEGLHKSLVEGGHTTEAKGLENTINNIKKGKIEKAESKLEQVQVLVNKKQTNIKIWKKQALEGESYAQEQLDKLGIDWRVKEKESGKEVTKVEETTIEEIPPTYKQKMNIYKKSDLGGGEGGKGTEKSDLVKEAETSEGKEYVKKEVDKLEKNEDGTITVYRVGNLNEGHNPTTTSKKTAEVIAKERKVEGLSSQIIETKVKPEDISVVVPGVEAELFVNVNKNNKSRINENSTTIQESQSVESLQQRIDKLQKAVNKTEKDLKSGKIKGNIYTNSVKKKKTEISNLEKQIENKKSKVETKEVVKDKEIVEETKVEELTKTTEELSNLLDKKENISEESASVRDELDVLNEKLKSTKRIKIKERREIKKQIKEKEVELESIDSKYNKLNDIYNEKIDNLQGEIGLPEGIRIDKMRFSSDKYSINTISSKGEKLLKELGIETTDSRGYVKEYTLSEISNLLSKTTKEVKVTPEKVETTEVPEGEFAEHTFGKTSSASRKGKTFRVVDDGSTMGKIYEVGKDGEIIREITGKEKDSLYNALKISKGAGQFYKEIQTTKVKEGEQKELEIVEETAGDRETITKLTRDREYIDPNDKSLGKKPLTFQEQRDLANSRRNIDEINKQQLKEELERIDIAEKESLKTTEEITIEETPVSTASVSEKVDLKTVTKKGKEKKKNVATIKDGEFIGEKRTEEGGFFTTEKQALVEGKDIGYSIVKTEKKSGKNYRTIKNGYSVKINGKSLPENFKTIEDAKEFIYNRNQNIQATSSNIKGEKNIIEAINNLDNQQLNLTSSINNIKNPKTKDKLNKLYIKKLTEINKEVEGILGKDINIEVKIDKVDGKNKVVLTTTVKNKKGEEVTITEYANNKIEAAKKLKEKIELTKKSEGKKVETPLEKAEREVLEKLEVIEKGDKKKNRDKIIEKLDQWEKDIDANLYSLPPGINLAPGVLKLSIKSAKLAIKATGKLKDGVVAAMNYLKSYMSKADWKKVDKKLLEQHLTEQMNIKPSIPTSKMFSEEVINYVSVLAESKGLDIKAFLKEAKTNGLLSEFSKQEIESLYNKGVENIKSNPERYESFIKKIQENTNLTKTQIKKDLNKVKTITEDADVKLSSTRFNDFATEIQTRVDNIERGVKIGETQKENEYKNIREEFNTFLSTQPLNLGIGNNRATLRIINNIKSESTLQQAIERVNKIVNDKKFRDSEILKQKTSDKILKISDVTTTKSGRKIAKKSYKATGGSAADIVTRLDDINKHIKASNNPKTGFDYVIKSAERIEELRSEILEIENNKEYSLKERENEIEKRKKELEVLRFSQLNNMSQSQLNQALKDITELSEKGRTKREEVSAERYKNYKERNDIVISIITGGKGIKTGISKLISGKDKKGGFTVFDNNLKTVLRKLSLKDKSGGKEMFGDYLMKEIYIKNVKVSEDNASKSHRTHYEKFSKDVSEILNTKERNLPVKLEKLRITKKTGIKVTDVDGVTTELNLSKLNAIEKIMQWKDITLRNNFETMGYTEKTIKDLENYVGPEGLKVGDYLFTQYQKFYETYNSTYREIFGVDMPSMGEFYSPIKIEGKAGEKSHMEIGDFTDFHKIISNSHMMRRTKNNERLEYGDALDTYFNYFESMERFQNYSKTVKEMNSVFGDKNVREAIRQNYGSNYLKVLDYYTEVFSGRQQRLQYSGVSTVVNNLTGGILMMKPSIMLKQFFSTAVYGSQMPGPQGKAEFLIGLLKGGQGGTVDISQSEFVKSRDKAFLDYSQSIKRGNVYSRSQWDNWLSKTGDKTNLRNVTDKIVMGGARWKNIFRNVVQPVQSVMLRYGDKAGISWGGQVYADFRYKQYIKEGKSKEQAHELALRDFELLAEASQQSQRASNISYARGKGGDFAKPFTMFTSSMIQLHQLSAMSAKEIANNKNVGRNTATILAAHVLLGQVFTLAGNSFKWDDEKQTWGLILGNSEGIFAVGKVITLIKNSIIGDYDSGVSPILDHIQGILSSTTSINDAKAKKEEADYKYFHTQEITEKQYQKILVDTKEVIEKHSNKINKKLFNLTGVGVEGALNLYEDIGTVYRGETDNPIREILGFENDWTVGRELYQIFSDDPTLPERRPSDADMEHHKLTRETARLKTILFDIDASNKLSETELRIKKDTYFDNLNKIKEIEINKLQDKEDVKEYIKNHEKIIRDYERILLTPKKID